MARGKNNKGNASKVSKTSKVSKVPRKQKREESELSTKPFNALAPIAGDEPKLIDPDQDNKSDVEDINELINNDIETDEEWEDDEEGDGGDEGYDNRFGDSDADDADDCAYDVTRRKKPGLNLDDIDDDEDVLDDDLDEFDDPSAATFKTIIPSSERICTRTITKYERVRLLCDRTTQLALGAKPMILGVEGINHSDREKMIAQLEFEARVIPIIIERERPDGAYEEWKISELKFKEDMIVYGKDAFSDPETLTIDPQFIKKRVKELQTGGNITGFTKVSQAPAFTLAKHNFGHDIKSAFNTELTPLESLLGIDDLTHVSNKRGRSSKTSS
jgi:DNA-directed RNA polymerase subunit K/omega